MAETSIDTLQKQKPSIERSPKQKPGAENWEKQRGFPSTVAESSGMSFSQIAQDLGIKIKWLEDQGGYRNANVFTLDNKTLLGVKSEKYDWGGPRTGDQYRVVRTGSEYHLYRYRPITDTITYIPIPEEGLGKTLIDHSKKVSEITSNIRQQVAQMKLEDTHSA